MHARRWLVIGATVVLSIAVALPALAGSATTQLMSKSSAGDPGNSESRRPSISASGRFVAFESDADNLVTSDGAVTDVFVRDRRTERTTLISRTSAGDPAGGSNQIGSLGSAISASGRFVVFHSNSSNLPGDHSGGQTNICIRDREAGKTRLVSKTSSGDPTTGGHSQFPTVSASGRFVAFNSQATNLPGDHTYPNVYIRDRETGRTRLASRTSDGDPATGGQSVGALISPTGRYVGFESNATNLGGDDTKTDVFVHDRKTGKLRLISRNSAGEPATGGDSYGGWISKSGRFVGFESGATNLPGDHTDGQFDSYVRDLETGRTKLVSKTSAGDPTTGGNSVGASISYSGRFVAFRSKATNLPGDNTYFSAYVRDRKTGRTVLVSRNSAGTPTTGGDTESPMISAFGDFVAFASKATNLAGDNSFLNVYARGPLR